MISMFFMFFMSFSFFYMILQGLRMVTGRGFIGNTFFTQVIVSVLISIAFIFIFSV